MKSALQPTGLMCDLLTDTRHATISNAGPTFSWIVNDRQPNAHQEAYQILVASSADLLAQNQGDLWDTGEPDPGAAWQSNNRSIHVRYDGQPLKPHTTVHWKVRTWNGVGNDSPWSLPCTFRTGDLAGEHMTDCRPLTITEIAPEVVVQTAVDRWFIDFGRAAFATVELTLDCPADGTVDIVLGEVPEGRYGINPAPGGSRRYQVVPLSVQSGRRTYRLEIPPDPRNTGDFAIRMPGELFEVYPFRYVEIVGDVGTLTLDDVRQICVHYPFDDSASSFTSSSKVLNDVWDLCKYTMKATSFCGYYVDGDRERIPYEADVYINQLGHYCCDREYAMARRTHEYLITTPTWPTEWILDSVLVAWNDYLYTGNADSLEQFYPDLKAKALTDIAREDGLITLELMTDDVLEAIHYAGRPAAQFKRSIEDNPDWPQAERDGFDMRPVNAEVNAFHYRAVTQMAAIAEALGQDEDQRWYRAAGQADCRKFSGEARRSRDRAGARRRGQHPQLAARQHDRAGIRPGRCGKPGCGGRFSQGQGYGVQRLWLPVLDGGALRRPRSRLRALVADVHDRALVGAHGLRRGHDHDAGGMGRPLQAQPGLESSMGRGAGQHHPAPPDGRAAAFARLRADPHPAPARFTGVGGTDHTDPPGTGDRTLQSRAWALHPPGDGDAGQHGHHSDGAGAGVG